jgi:hypothetical protein
MNDKIKIQKLWDYLKIQDDELLIIPIYNPYKDTDECIVAQMVNHQLESIISDTMPDLNGDIAFQIIKQRNANGKHYIPSVDQLIRDKLEDY